MLEVNYSSVQFSQAKNGEALPPGPLPRAQRPPQTLSKEAAAGGGDREEAEQKALLAVQCSLLKILSKTLATLRHFTPDCCQILLDQVCSRLNICLIFSSQLNYSRPLRQAMKAGTGKDSADLFLCVSAWTWQSTGPCLYSASQRQRLTPMWLLHLGPCWPPSMWP